MYVLVTKKNWWLCEAHLRYPCNFLAAFQGHINPAMKIDMHIFSVCMQYGDKHIHFSRVTYKRIVHVHSPCKCCKISPFTCRVCTSHAIHSRVPCIIIKPPCDLYLVAVYFLCSSGDTLVGKIHLVCTCKSLLPHYQAMFIFFNNIYNTLMCAYTYDGM